MVNGIAVRGRDQVMLKVTVAEVQRDVIKQLGIDLGTLGNGLTSGQAILNFTNNNPFPVVGQALVNSNAITLSYKGVSATLRAMERAGIIRTLAEPNADARSRASPRTSSPAASFRSQPAIPAPPHRPSERSATASTQIEWKKFGVGLNFTPVVMSEGRISLKVLTEVSELSTDNQLTLTQAVSSSSTTTLTIPSIKTRRAETTVEIPSGGTLAMAGMIQEQTKQQLNGIPGLMNLPVLGALFKSRDYVNRQSELVVMVTPYMVRAVAQKDLARPDDGYADASDAATTLLGRFNRLYGKPGQDDPRQQTYRGNVGFFLD